MYRIMLAVLALSLAACSKVTITRSDNQVIAVGTGSVLQSATSIIDHTNTVAVYACTVEKVVGENSTGSGKSGTSGVMSYSYFEWPNIAENIAEILKQVKETAEQGRGLLNLFGEHSYTVTLSCLRTPKLK